MGFVRAGFTIVWANDIFTEAVETYKVNIGNHILDKNISDIPSSEIPECDGIIGGFPCQGFSIANTNRSVDDSRNQLYREFVRVVSDKKPKFFVAENVKGIRTIGKGEVFKKIISDFSDAGYVVRDCLLNAADFGVPQMRERVFLFGLRKDLQNQTEENFPPEISHSKHPDLIRKLEKWVSISEVLQDIPAPSDQSNLPNHTGTKYKMRFNGYLGHRMVDPDSPAPTITARGDDKGGVVIIHHPSNERRLTVREAALVQSFPIDFAFEGSNTNAYRQIANAVPPLLAEHVAKSVLASIQ